MNKNKFSYYKINRKEGWDLILSSSSGYDKAIISLSTATFGFISAFIKLSSDQVICKPFIILILALLILSILCALLSFWFDQLFGTVLMNYAKKYSENKNEPYYKGCSYYASLITKILSGTFFFIALVLFFTIFCINL